jgi:hypothetical protein
VFGQYNGGMKCPKTVPETNRAESWWSKLPAYRHSVGNLGSYSFRLCCELPLFILQCCIVAFLLVFVISLFADPSIISATLPPRLFPRNPPLHQHPPRYPHPLLLQYNLPRLNPIIPPFNHSLTTPAAPHFQSLLQPTLAPTMNTSSRSPSAAWVSH